MSTSKAGDAAYRVLAEEGKPLHYKDIALIAIGKGYWKTDSPDPEASMNMALNYEIREKNGHSCRFKKSARGWFMLKNFDYTVASDAVTQADSRIARVESLLVELVKEVEAMKNAS